MKMILNDAFTSGFDTVIERWKKEFGINECDGHQLLSETTLKTFKLGLRWNITLQR